MNMTFVDGIVNYYNYKDFNIRIYGSSRKISARDALIKPTFIISSVVSSALLIFLLWTRWRECRGRSNDTEHVQQHTVDNVRSEEDEKRLRGKVLGILPTKV